MRGTDYKEAQRKLLEKLLKYNFNYVNHGDDSMGECVCQALKYCTFQMCAVNCISIIPQ